MLEFNYRLKIDLRGKNSVLKCPICEKEYLKIDTQHLKKHNLTKEEYFEKFGELAPFGYSKELILKKSGENHPRFGRILSPESKQKISKGLKLMWSENRVSDAQKNSLGNFSSSSKGENHFNRGRTFDMSEEQKQLISEKLIKYWKTVKDKSFSEERLTKYNKSIKYKVAKSRKFGTILKYTNNLEQWAKVQNLDIQNDNITVICKTCNSEISVQCQTVRKHLFSNTLCHTCYPIFQGSSKLEEEIIKELKLLDPELIIRRHDKTFLPNNLEIDIFLPAFNLGIEVNGLYWHSDLAGYNNQKHLFKTEMCAKNNIQLIHIFENEWIQNKEIVLSRLQNKIGKSNKIMGRNCYVKQITRDISISFFDENHLQKYTNSLITFGLFNNDNLLVAAMSFGKPRFNKDYEWELIRFVSLKGYYIIGGANKLLRFFEKQLNPISLISYADKRWSNGNLYYKLGFELKGTSQPSYYYFKKSPILENRLNFQKHKLKKILPLFNENKTEWENMKDNGYNRIWDCGNLVFVKEY